MYIDDFIRLPGIVEKPATKHHVTMEEAQEVFFNHPRFRFVELQRTLVIHRVEFIIVGGVCAVLHGAPITTFDLDMVHSRTPGNRRDFS